MLARSMCARPCDSPAPCHIAQHHTPTSCATKYTVFARTHQEVHKEMIRQVTRIIDVILQMRRVVTFVTGESGDGVASLTHEHPSKYEYST
eukprot:3606655-Pleurochrysis_carterae.AAC.1